MSTAPEVPVDSTDDGPDAEVEPAFSDMSWEGPTHHTSSEESRAIESPVSEIPAANKLSRQKTLLNTAAIASLWQENKRYDQWPGKSGLVVMSNVIVMAAEVFTIIEHRFGMNARADYDNIEALTLYVDSLVSSNTFSRELLRNYAKDAIAASFPPNAPGVLHMAAALTLGVSLSEEARAKLSSVPGVTHVSDEKDGKISVYIVDARARRKIPPRIEGKEIIIKAARHPLDNEELSSKAMNRLLAIQGVTSVGISDEGTVLVYTNDKNADKKIPNSIEGHKVETIYRVKLSDNTKRDLEAQYSETTKPVEGYKIDDEDDDPIYAC
jgi:hypothetical protein